MTTNPQVRDSAVADRPVRTAIYVRISKDRTGQEAGVKRQVEDCLGLCQRLGLTVVETFKDNDMSAYSGKPRPEFEKMVTRLENGEFDAIVAYHVNRLYRQLKDLERLIDIIGEKVESGVQLHTVKAGDYDLSDSNGRMVARLTGTIAQGQSEQSSELIQRWAEAQAKVGAPHGSRAYGYEADGITINQKEAKILREVAQKLLSGQPMYAVCKDLNKRGERTVPQRRHFEDGTKSEPYGKPWYPTALKKVLLRRRNIGERKHLTVIRNQTETARSRRTPVIYKAQWDGILDLDTYQALERLFNRGNPLGAGRKPGEHKKGCPPDCTRSHEHEKPCPKDCKKAHVGGPAPVHLGTGLYICGACGKASMNQTTGHGTASYRCTKRNAPGVSRHVTRNAEKFDLFVQDVLCEYFRMHKFVEAMCAAVRGDDAKTAELVTEQERITRFLRAFRVDDDAEEEAAQAAQETINAKSRRLKEIRAELAALDKRSSLEALREKMHELDLPAEQAWYMLGMEQKRAILAEVLTVTILQHDHTSPVFRPNADVQLSPYVVEVYSRHAALPGHGQLSETVPTYGIEGS